MRVVVSPLDLYHCNGCMTEMLNHYASSLTHINILGTLHAWTLLAPSCPDASRMHYLVMLVTPQSLDPRCCISQIRPRSQQTNHTQLHPPFAQIHPNTSSIHLTKTHEASLHALKHPVSVQLPRRVPDGRHGVGEPTPLRLTLNLTDTPRSQRHRQ